MRLKLSIAGKPYSIDTESGVDISLKTGRVRCFYAPEYLSYPFQSGDFTGSVSEGAPVNFYNVRINPHGHGTHTECIGHITEKQEDINDTLQQFHFIAKLVSIRPYQSMDGDRCIGYDELRAVLVENESNVLVVRTLPNDDSKKTMDYSGSNPPYFTAQAMEYIVGCGIEHLLIDLPSVDREVDEGRLTAHKIFWQFHSVRRSQATITELVYVPASVSDGWYFLNLQLAPIPLDAAPSRPVLYSLIPEK